MPHIQTHAQRMRQGRQCADSTAFSRGSALLGLVVLSSLVTPLVARGDSSSSTDDMIYGNTFTRSWLYDSKSLSIKVEGCAWGHVDDSEEVGCLEDDSDEGTTNWYMMANCRRPQVVFSVYASSSGSTSCNDKNFVGSVSFPTLCRIFVRSSMRAPRRQVTNLEIESTV